MGGELLPGLLRSARNDNGRKKARSFVTVIANEVKQSSAFL
jgi:hypothetical protein